MVSDFEALCKAEKPARCFLFQKKPEARKMKDKCFLNAEDVASFMDVPIPAACKIIRKLDDELKKPGHITTVAGKISGAGFESKACLSE